MTDPTSGPGRIDLRAIDEPVDALQAERVIRGAMARATARRYGDDDGLTAIAVYSRPVLAAAAALLVIATGALIATKDRVPGDDPSRLLAAWAQGAHVPTNGELLTAFQGYGR